MTRRLAAVIGLAVALGGVVFASPARGQDAASVTAVGWWTSVPVTSAPEGGVAVGQGGSGPTAVAALQLFVADEPPTSATITLAEADGVNAAGALMDVCPTPNQWEPVAGGPMADAPKAECETGSVELTRGEDGTWAADVTSLLEPGSMSLMIVPAVPAEGEGPTPPFQVSFDAPALSATAAPSASPSSSSTGSSTGSEATPASAPTTVARPVTTVARPPVAPAVTTPSTVPVASGDAEVAVGPAVSVPTRATSPNAADGEGRPWRQTLFFCVLAAAVGTIAGVGRNQLRARRATA